MGFHPRFPGQFTVSDNVWVSNCFLASVTFTVTVTVPALVGFPTVVRHCYNNRYAVWPKTFTFCKCHFVHRIAGGVT
jgi:hypothetical protein